jgi:hypothetical protein
LLPVSERLDDDCFTVETCHSEMTCYTDATNNGNIVVKQVTGSETVIAQLTQQDVRVQDQQD